MAAAMAGWRWMLLFVALCFPSLPGSAAGQETLVAIRQLEALFDRVETEGSSGYNAIDDLLLAFKRLTPAEFAALEERHIDRFGRLLWLDSGYVRMIAALCLADFGARAERMLPAMHWVGRAAKARREERSFGTGPDEFEAMSRAMTRIEFDLGRWTGIAR